jgi:glyoxylase-like metal-dependent hydrolase (beta-lactamase superfamily II)
MTQTLKTKRFCLGDWATNCYLAYTDSGACWIIDAGFEPDYMLRHIREKELRPKKIVLTHAHVDHVGGLAEVCEAYPDIPVLIHEAERDFPADPMLNLSALMGFELIAPEPTGTFAHGDTLTLDGIDFGVRHTPGHSPGGICLYQPEHAVAIVGDTLFAGSIGRSDFPTSDGQALVKSIREQLYTMPDQTRVLPGHGPETSIGAERASNPFVPG